MQMIAEGADSHLANVECSIHQELMSSEFVDKRMRHYGISSMNVRH